MRCSSEQCCQIEPKVKDAHVDILFKCIYLCKVYVPLVSKLQAELDWRARLHFLTAHGQRAGLSFNALSHANVVVISPC